MRTVALAPFLLACAAPAAAQEVPSFARNKPLAANLDRKEEGNHVEGLPLVGYDTNLGFGLGLGGYFTMNGRATDPLFRVTPYRHRFFAQAYFTTGGYQQHILSYDGLYLGDSPYRVRASFMFERNIAANYFGVGERTLAPLEFQGRTFSSYDDQSAAAAALQGGVASPLYDHYEYDRPTGQVSLERDLFGGLVRLQYGLGVQYVGISRYDGTETSVDVNGKSTAAVHGATKLGLDCAAGVVRGCDGGWNDTLRLGVAFDTRDFEPDPRSGVFADLTGEWSAKGFGSAYDYLRVTFASRFFWSLLPRKWTELVLASRLLYSIETAGAPFYAMSFLSLTEANQEGLGGENTLRGYRQNRFVGPMAAVANVELRWTFVHFRVLKQQFSLQAAPFLDVGRVFDTVRLDFTGWRASYGGALRVAWNRTTLVRFDFGASREDTGFYVDFGMPF